MTIGYEGLTLADFLAILRRVNVETLVDVRELPLSGVAVTMPLKQEVLPHLTNMDPLTSRIGACNTLRTGADGKLYGFNTDVAGVVRPLEKRIRLKGARQFEIWTGKPAPEAEMLRVVELELRRRG